MTSVSLASADAVLPLRGRADLDIRPMTYAQTRYWVVKDPLALRYFQLREEEQYILSQLDGTVSLAEVCRRFERRFAPRQLRPELLHALLANFYRQGLVVSLRPGQGQELLRRKRQQVRGLLLAALSNPLAIRLPGIAARPIVERLYPWCRWIFGPTGLLLAAISWLVAFMVLIARWQELPAAVAQARQLFSWHYGPWLILGLAVVRLLHELGHALTLRHFGGQCRELGLMFLLASPCLYCDVSDAWLLRSKWQRLAVSAAGMAVELVLASWCAVLWSLAWPGPLQWFCLSILVVASLGTVLVNGNPLLRYDGYYLLSDFLEIPNLHEQAFAALRSVAGRCLGGQAVSPDRWLNAGREWPLAAFALAVLAYRLVLVVLVLCMCHRLLLPSRLEALAWVLALGTMAAMVAPPLGRAWFGSRPPAELETSLPRGMLRRWGPALLMLVGLLLIPLPYGLRVPVVLEAADARLVYVTTPGRLVEAQLAGTTLAAGDRLARLENHSLDAEVARLDGEQQRHQQHVTSLERRRVDDPTAAAELPTARAAWRDAQQQWSERKAEQDRLELAAPISGTLLPPRKRTSTTADSRSLPDGIRDLPEWDGSPLDKFNLGCYLETGTLLGRVADPQQLEALVVLQQADATLVRVGQKVRLSVDQWPGEILSGTLAEIAAIDLDQVPPELAARGDLPIAPNDAATGRAILTYYRARVAIDAPPVPLLTPATGRARITVEPRSLAWRLWRAVSRSLRFDW